MLVCQDKRKSDAATITDTATLEARREIFAVIMEIQRSTENLSKPA